MRPDSRLQFWPKRVLAVKNSCKELRASALSVQTQMFQGALSQTVKTTPFLAICTGAIAFVSFLRLWLARERVRLPPGSLGVPLLGETLAFLQGPEAFIEARLRRYGGTFKTNVLFTPTVFLAVHDKNAKLIHGIRGLFLRVRCADDRLSQVTQCIKFAEIVMLKFQLSVCARVVMVPEHVCSSSVKQSRQRAYKQVSCAPCGGDHGFPEYFQKIAGPKSVAFVDCGSEQLFRFGYVTFFRFFEYTFSVSTPSVKCRVLSSFL